jgi:hypothetical protein
MYNRLIVTLTITALAAIGFTAAPASAAPSPRLIQRLIDPATGAAVDVVRQRENDLTIVATGKTVTVERHVVDGRVITTLRTRGHQVSITPGSGRILLRIDGRAIVVAAGDTRAAAVAREAMTGSAVVQDAIDFLGHLALPVEQPVTSMLQLTRASLIGATGDAVGAFAVIETMRADLARSVSAVKASFEMESSCWQDYEKEALAAVNDFASCMKDIPWYDFWDPETCKALYDMQAVGAWTEWAHCVSLWEIR